MDNLAKKETRHSKNVTSYIPAKTAKVMDEGYEALRQGLIGHISRSPYQEYFFKNPNEVYKREESGEAKAHS
ncbi:MAG: hypothetical protein ACOH5I_09685 [Oligoflexus sp.]